MGHLNTTGKISESDLIRFHDAARRIEADGHEGYYTVRELYGADIAGVLLVAFLRFQHGAMETFPAKPEVREKTDAFLKTEGIA